MLMFSQYICNGCGHGIHMHVDYASMVVNHHPPLNVLRISKSYTPLAQRCTCKAQLCDHIAIDKLYRSPEPWNILDYFPYSNDPSSNVDRSSNNSMKSPFMSNSTTGGNFMPVTPTPVSSAYIASPAFGPSCVPPYLMSWTSLTPKAYNPDSYSDPFINSYARQSDGEATNGSYEYQNYPNEMHGAIPETWSAPYA
ncbi:hypothetical protein EV421DRAFT_1909061 [Armillaria borealis]|uniref:Uncharacterized protein n=1 Tax=Armillaria borealis TaxID=47425 RepID=A0AA39J3T9_9AGAR|nr:hypothetical protein EV421DRAFT_1909061 [Armillaria borealis]